MNFAFSEEQEELRSIVRSFLEAKSSESDVREQMATERGYDPDVWAQMAEQLATFKMSKFCSTTTSTDSSSNGVAMARKLFALISFIKASKSARVSLVSSNRLMYFTSILPLSSG